MKIFIDWPYKINPLCGTWENSSIENCDVILTVDCRKKYNKKCLKLLWLYETKSISHKLCRHKAYESDYGDYDYVFTYDKSYNTNKSKVIYMDCCFPSWIKINNMNIFSKTKNISMICSNKNMCEHHAYRLKTKDFLSEQINIDIYGKGFNEIKEKEQGLCDYRFSVAMENDICNCYYTEKILDCFLTGTVPIYYGSRCVNDVFDSRGIIFLDDYLKTFKNFNYEEEYNFRLPYIQNNFEIAKNKIKKTVSDCVSLMVETINKKEN